MYILARRHLGSSNLSQVGPPIKFLVKQSSAVDRKGITLHLKIPDGLSYLGERSVNKEQVLRRNNVQLKWSSCFGNSTMQNNITFQK